MKKFLAVYVGTAGASEKARWDEMGEGERDEIEARGMRAWMAWGEAQAGAIVDGGAPLGKTKRVGKDGIADTANAMTGYVIVTAESHEAAARVFEGHPHFSVFPGDSVEVMECLPIPGQ